MKKILLCVFIGFIVFIYDYSFASTTYCKHCGCDSDFGVISNTSTYHTYKCNRCFQTFNENHEGGTATCTSKRKCSVIGCGASYGDYASHTGGTATCISKKVCTVCKKSYGDYAAHKGGTATCTVGKICTVCGKAYTEPLGHITPETFASDDNYHWKLCDRRCGTYVYKKEQHYGGIATTTTRKKCKICGNEYGDLLSTKYTADSEEVNAPVLLDGMTPIKWAGESEENKWVTTTEDDEEWYSYNSNEKQFANVKLKDGSRYVWVPRFTYKLDLTNNMVDYSWSNGVEDNENEGFIKTNAFTYGDNELTGIWVAKFLASEVDGLLTSKADKDIDTSKNISNAYLTSKDMMYYNFSKYGVNDIAESHLLKNSEFAAISYLALVENSKGSTIPWNNITSKTGYVGSSKDANSGTAYKYSSVEGRNGSTTHNIYGIYDMSGTYEFVSSYLYGGNLTNGEYLGYIEEGIDVDKYLENYSDFSLGKDSDYVGSLTKDTPFMARGGNYKESEKSGMFGYKGVNGGAGCGYRNVIIPIDLHRSYESRIYALEPKETVAEGGEITLQVNLSISEGNQGTFTKEELLNALDLTFTQTSDDKIVTTKGLNAEILYVNDEEASENINLIVGNNKIKVKLGGVVDNVPIFRYVKNSIGRISIYSSEDINLNTLELDVVKTTESTYEKSAIKEISVVKEPKDIVDGRFLDNGKIKVIRDDDTEEIISMICDEVENSVEGNKVNLTYDGATTSFNLLGDSTKVFVKVNNAKGSGIYTKGENIVLDCSSINGNKFSKWTNVDGAEVMHYTVSETSCEIEAEISKVIKVEIERAPVKLEYSVNEVIDLRGGRLKVTFENGSIDYVDMLCDNVYAIIGDAFKSVGTKNIVVAYGDNVATFYITVK